jgi:cytochrome P450
MTKPPADLPELHIEDAAFMNGQLPAVIARQAEAHGPIFQRTVADGPYAGRRLVWMVGPEANRFVFHTHRDHFSHDLGWTPIIGETMGQGLLNMDDPEHAVHRKMWNPAFAGSYMSAYLPLIQRVIADRTRSWPERKEIDLYRESREITFDVAATALAGFRTGAEVDRLRELFYTLLHADDVVETEEEYWERALKAREELIGMLLPMIAARRQIPPRDHPKHLVEMLVHPPDQQRAALSDAQVLAHLNILLVAGHETTTTLGAWMLYLLATRPADRARIDAELAAIPRDAGGSLSIDSIRAMKQLDMFIRETGRLYPPVLTVPRGVARDFEFAGYGIPAGTTVRLSLAGAHRLAHVFADPDRFDLDRFAPPREEDKKTPYALVTFGGGTRVCIGQHFAQVEVKALADHVLDHYDLEPVSPQPPLYSGFITAFVPGGIRMRVRRRS